jgi:hypothetical protein
VSLPGQGTFANVLSAVDAPASRFDLRAAKASSNGAADRQKPNCLPVVSLFSQVVFDAGDQIIELDGFGQKGESADIAGGLG